MVLFTQSIAIPRSVAIIAMHGNSGQTVRRLVSGIQLGAFWGIIASNSIVAVSCCPIRIAISLLHRNCSPAGVHDGLLIPLQLLELSTRLSCIWL